MNTTESAAVDGGLSAIERLKVKALSLPLQPGVYIMADKKGKVIYVGKAKRLRNRVTSYFQDSAAHSPKTRRMVERVYDFDTIITVSEFEALVLECSLIRRHRPRYNIKLKDGSGYPFIRLSPGAYPALSVVHDNQLVKDGSRYYGPYGGWGISQTVIDSLQTTLRLPSCKRVFPRDIGKGRPCLQFHMNRCIGVCRGGIGEEAFNERIRRAVLMMEGKTAGLYKELEAEMQTHAENLRFEAAAQIRDEMRSIEALSRRQIVVGGGMADTDAVAAVIGEARNGVAVLHYLDGNLMGRDTEMSEETGESPEELLSAFVSQYYMTRGKIPRYVLLSHPIEDTELLKDAFLSKGMKTEFLVPQRGQKAELVKMAARNAAEEIARVTTREEKTRFLLSELKRILSLPEPPERIESVDISNTGDSGRVGAMVCYKNGKPLKKAYKQFIIKNQDIRDDYHSMEEVLTRRFARLIKGEAGFDEAPDLLLVDGGATHASMARRVLDGFGLDIPVFGMVKDDKHRTRAVVNPDGAEAALTGSPGVFALVAQIQEETHRSAIAFHQKQRSKFDSELDGIAGLGGSRKDTLLRHFKSVQKIASATPEELEALLPKSVAVNVYNHFHNPCEPA
ncbi:MAG: excinuclease ABC subunit UvrC [Oscillospiraceae bacterium]|jgi:excinuclease ABC subunit C|nr:excinuclease ABC subunit UvrC [Oscillospiraceae bacterium]